MIALIAALAFGTTKPSGLFDVCLANHVKLKVFSVHLQIASSEPGKSQNTQYDLAVKGNDAKLRVREPATGILDKSDRTFFLRGNKLVGYDAIADERLQRNLKGNGSLSTRLSSQLGQLDDALTLAIDLTVMRKFFAGFKDFKDWKTSQSGGVTTLRRSAKGTETMFRFAGNHPLLREILIKLKDRVLHWTYDFRSGAEVDMHLPSDVRNVMSFTVREAPPTYMSEKAKQVVEKMIKAYGALTTGTINVNSYGVKSRLLLGGRRLREDQNGFSWAYDGTNLSMMNFRNGKFYRGVAKRPILSEYVAKVGGEVDPIIIRLLSRRIPYLDLFPSGGTVRFVGSSGSGSSKADILDVRTPSLKVSLFVRQDNHLLQSMESETVDRPGKTQTRSQREFKYSNMGEAAPVSSFRLSPGKAKVLPLPVVVGG